MHEIINMLDLVLCPTVFIFLFDEGQQGKFIKSYKAQIYKKLSFTGFFTRLGTFPQVFRHVKMWLILELHEIIRVSHLVTCPVVFILFDD